MDEPTPPPLWSRVKELFEVARALPAEGRSTYLADVSGGDAALRLEVESLLAAYDRADRFLEKTAAEIFMPVAMPALLEGRDIGPYHLSERIGVAEWAACTAWRESRRHALPVRTVRRWLALPP